jgi:hypothetical protein
MSHHLTATLDQLKAEILEDGIIDADEVGWLRERLYDDGVIDEEEADFLFALNDAVSGQANHASWGELFAQAIADFVLKDDVSPGVVDEDEAAYLYAKLWADGQIDDVERLLIAKLKAEAKGPIPAKLQALFDLL